MEFNGIKLVQTCVACPEQYDAYKDGKKVGFLYMRNGEFTVNYPNLGGQLIYSACPAGSGCFKDVEREMYLKNACLAIERHMQRVSAHKEVCYAI